MSDLRNAQKVMETAIPHGQKLVPVELTPEMIHVGCQNGTNIDGRPLWKHTVDVQAKWRWAQMLSVSPDAPVTGMNVPTLSNKG